MASQSRWPPKVKIGEVLDNVVFWSLRAGFGILEDSQFSPELIQKLQTKPKCWFRGGIYMAYKTRGAIKNSVEDLQIEYATDFPNLSIRDFLIQKKGFTSRQYRYIISLASANDWRARCQEIQNDIAAKKIAKYAEDATQVHGQYLAASKLVLARALEILIPSSKASPQNLKPSDLLSCIGAIARAQEVFMKAMGIEKSEGLLQIYEQVSQTVQAKVSISEHKTELQREMESRLTYDDVMEFVRYRRELRQSRRGDA